jgi:endoglucanase
MQFFRKMAGLVALAALTTTAGAQGFLRAEGRDLVDADGRKIILRGMGLGGWMLQEGYMFRLSPLGQQYKIKAAIADVTSKEKADAFYRKWLANHTRKVDIDSMAAWGFNSIRLPMHYALYTLPAEEEPVKGKDTWLEEGFALTDELLKWCEANRMYLILDLHAAPGGQGNDLPISDRNPDKPSLWQSEANQQKTVALWRKLAERYKNSRWIGGYDIINEPNWGFEDPKDVRGTAETKNEPLKKLLVDITKAIREVDPNHLIIIEGNGFGNNYSGLMPAWDKNMALSFHKYGNYNSKAAIQKFLDLRQQYNVPIWLGETGENSNNWFTECIRLCERENIGWCWWQEKKMGIANPLEIRQPAGYQKLVDYWTGKGEKPSASEAERTLNEWLDNLKLENNVYHRDVIDAMFRQTRSELSIPYVAKEIGGGGTIRAVDFDLGRQRSAYFDRDTASYQYTPGVNTTGNRGRVYRNDGVDIRKAGNQYVVDHIEDGEWLQYTFWAKKDGKYDISFSVASETDAGRITLLLNGEMAATDIAVPATGGVDRWRPTEKKNVSLRKGKNVLRVWFDTGGFQLSEISLTKN